MLDKFQHWSLNVPEEKFCFFDSTVNETFSVIHCILNEIVPREGRAIWGNKGVKYKWSRELQFQGTRL